MFVNRKSLLQPVALLALTFVPLTGCGQQTIDEQFEALCTEQKHSDPGAWASTEAACANKEYLQQDQKKVLIDAYAALKDARAEVEQ